MSKHMRRFVFILSGRSGAWSGQAGHPLREAVLAVSPPEGISPQRARNPGAADAHRDLPGRRTRATRPAPRWVTSYASGDRVVYDMYPWNQPADGSGAGRSSRRPARRPRPRRTGPAAPATPAAQALQMALDRRDNGGESAATAGQ